MQRRQARDAIQISKLICSKHHKYVENNSILVFTPSDRALNERKCVTFHPLGSITPVSEDYVVGSEQFITALHCTLIVLNCTLALQYCTIEIYVVLHCSITIQYSNVVFSSNTCYSYSVLLDSVKVRRITVLLSVPAGSVTCTITNCTVYRTVSHSPTYCTLCHQHSPRQGLLLAGHLEPGDHLVETD